MLSESLMYGNSLFLNIKHINHARHWIFRTGSEWIPSQEKLDPLGNMQVYLFFSAVGCDVIFNLFH